MISPRFELGIFMYWSCNSTSNLLSYCGLVDAKIIASDKDLPVMKDQKNTAGMGISVMVTRSITQMINVNYNGTQ